MLLVDAYVHSSRSQETPCKARILLCILLCTWLFPSSSNRGLHEATGSCELQKGSVGLAREVCGGQGLEVVAFGPLGRVKLGP